MSKSIKSLMFILLAMTISQLSAAESPEAALNFSEPRDYVTKFPNETVDKPVVVEFFSFMCPACFRMESIVQRWLKQKPEDVEFVRIPVVMGNGSWRLVAKSYYIAEELKVTEQFEKKIFSKIHVEKRPPRNESQMSAVFQNPHILN